MLLIVKISSLPFFLKTAQLKENQKLSKEEVSFTLKRIQDLEVCKNKQDPLWCDKHVHDKCFALMLSPI